MHSYTCSDGLFELFIKASYLNIIDREVGKFSPALLRRSSEEVPQKGRIGTQSCGLEARALQPARLPAHRQGGLRARAWGSHAHLR